MTLRVLCIPLSTIHPTQGNSALMVSYTLSSVNLNLISFTFDYLELPTPFSAV